MGLRPSALASELLLIINLQRPTFAQMASKKPFNFSTTTELARHEVEKIVRTKRNLCNFLTMEVNYVLPPINFTSMEWLSGIWRGELRVSAFSVASVLTSFIVKPLRSTETKPCYANHIKGLRIPNLVEFARSNGIELYMPVPNRTGQPPRYHRMWLLTVSALSHA